MLILRSLNFMHGCRFHLHAADSEESRSDNMLFNFVVFTPLFTFLWVGIDCWHYASFVVLVFRSRDSESECTTFLLNQVISEHPIKIDCPAVLQCMQLFVIVSTTAVCAGGLLVRSCAVDWGLCRPWCMAAHLCILMDRLGVPRYLKARSGPGWRFTAGFQL